ncbi:MAG: ATP synthase F1 subunit gamma [Crocinitomicaceae bacterium]|nr:ATP synthase F1 subunit gamma [Crocinitomicaceae bacterium]
MANLKEIRSRITSVASTMQITSAMKMVSAAKLKKAQDGITQMRPYSEKLQEILSNLTSSLDMSENQYAQDREVKNVLIVAVTSNRGLCGGFNNNIIKGTNQYIKNNPNENIQVLGLGKKAQDAFKRADFYHTAYGEDLTKVYDDIKFENIEHLGEYLMEQYKEGKFDKIYLFYNSFKNAATQEVKNEQFLPVEQTASETKTTSIDYIFEPSKEEIVDELIPKSLKTQLYKAVLDSWASEHGARMTAMHKATDNADALRKELTLSYNKARQAAITNEILEIVGGAEALNN